ncbi:MAG: pilus assembly protein TadG-related protein [Kouleothrix sp.]
MFASMRRTKKPGQSIPLIALLIVVLIGAAGLAVDVGNDYAQQRNTVRATNAAALAGMNAVIRGYDDQSIGKVIQQSLKSNNVDGIYSDPNAQALPNQRTIRALYLDSKGNPLARCNIGTCGNVPTGVTYIQIEVNGTVDTYFARVLQRPTLPVGAQAFAGRCAPIDGVYPIAVQDSTIANGKFAPPADTTKRVEPYYNANYRDPNWPVPLSKRRIYMVDNAATPGNFSFLRWRSAQRNGDAPALAAMLKAPGNLSAGFNEVTPWPDPGSQPPSSYPLKPGELNADDWIHGNTGRSNSAAVRAALDEHIALHDVMILPLVKPAADDPDPGINSAFRVTGLGAFYLVGYDLTGNNPYFDFVYIGEANSSACLSTPSVASNKLGVSGPVFFWPRWGAQQTQQPIAFQVIMDVSGSMSWNFQGQGNMNGNGATLQCEPYGNVPAVDCPHGGGDYWKTQSERRIYVLKEALRGAGGFIEKMRDGDVMRVLAFSDGSISAGPGWTGDKAALKDTVLNAGKYNNNPYLTSGGTPGPQALQKAVQQFASTPPPAQYNGQAYRKVVIYMTDGVANVFLNGVTNDARDVCSDLTVTVARNTALCQYDVDGYPATASKQRRPISEMINQASILKTTYPDLQLFVVALANVNPLGLDFVASSPNMLYLAKTSTVVDDILTLIFGKALGPCSEKDDGKWLNYIDPAHTAALNPPNNLPTGIYGYVYLFDSNKTPLNVPWSGAGADPRPAAQKNAVPVTQDGFDGKLGFEIPVADGLNAGLYYMQGYVQYKAALPDGDGASRIYSGPIVNGSAADYVPFRLTPEQVLGSAVVLDPLRLDLPNGFKLCP